MTSGTVRIWDPFIRVFHWSLATLFVVAWLTGDDAGWLHHWAGYGILVLIALRIVWGFAGGRYARFTAFVRSPIAALRYLGGLASGRAPRHLGHNPAGAWMAILLLLTLLLTGASGVIVLGLEGGGPLAGRIGATSPIVTWVGGGAEGREHAEDDDDDEYGEAYEGGAGAAAIEGAEDGWEEIHEFLANLSLFLVIVHVLGVFASSLAHRENLVRAMITGRKRAADRPPPEARGAAPHGQAPGTPRDPDPVRSGRS